MTDAGFEWLDDAQQATWQDMLTVVIGVPALLDRQLERDQGISNYEYSVLARLSLAEKHTMRLGELAGQCHSTLPRMSKVMTRFEGRGWTERYVDPDDGRYTLTRLTTSGLEKVEQCAPGHVNEVQNLVFGPLTPTQQRALGRALGPIAATVRRELDRR